MVEEDAQTENGEDTALSKTGLLPSTIEFLDHFDDALDVVVGCARKIEMTRWPRLFDIVGNPKILFEVCIAPNISASKVADVVHLVLPWLWSSEDSGIVPARAARPRAVGWNERRC